MPFKEKLDEIIAENGKEFAVNEVIAEGMDLEVYFARPYPSWEGGADENANGLIR